MTQKSKNRFLLSGTLKRGTAGLPPRPFFSAGCFTRYGQIIRTHRRSPKSTGPSEHASGGNTESEARASANNVENSSPNKTPATPRLASTDSPELLRLRRQVTELQNRVTNLSQSVAQQQALLGESNRIKFFQLASAPGNPGAASVPSLSPALQRALFIAMARELGWFPSADASFTGTNAAFAPGGNVDFVDLRPATNCPPKNRSAAAQHPGCNPFGTRIFTHSEYNSDRHSCVHLRQQRCRCD